ncbi:MAG: transporter ATP-binding protein, partial [Paenibacillus sp.]|nr:transporter ATP-binding protein [Paenibacillus sp.]
MIVQARTSSRASKSGALFRQLARIGRAMPLLTASWLAVPILLGVLVIPFYAAQRELVDTFIGGSSWPMGDRVQRIWQPLAIFTGVSLLQVLLTAIHTVVDTRFRDRATMLVQTEVMRKAVAVPLSRMEQADYYNRLQRATSVAGTDLLGMLQQAILLMRQMFELFGLLAVAWMTHPVIGGLLALVFAVSLAIRLESELVVRRLNRDLTQAGRQSDYLREELVKPGTIKELRVFGSLDYMLGTWGKQMRRSLELRMNARRREIKHGIIVSTVQVIGLFAAILWMALHLQSGAMTAGAFVAILLAMRQAHGLSGQMAHPISKMAIQSTKMADLAAFLNERDTDEQAADAVRSQNGEQGQLPQWPSPCGSIVFDRVAFRYANANADEPVLQDIRLSLRAGETVALVGENGAGKSTLVKLLLGLYKPTAGTISWDGIDYEKLDPDALRARMSAAFQ